MVPCVAYFYVPGLGVCVQLVVDFRDTALHRIRNADVYLFYLLPVMAADQRVQDTFVERVGREEQLIDDTAMFYRIGDKCKSVERIERPQEKISPGLGSRPSSCFKPCIFSVWTASNLSMAAVDFPARDSAGDSALSKAPMSKSSGISGKNTFHFVQFPFFLGDACFPVFLQMRFVSSCYFMPQSPYRLFQVIPFPTKLWNR